MKKKACCSLILITLLLAACQAQSFVIEEDSIFDQSNVYDMTDTCRHAVDGIKQLQDSTKSPNYDFFYDKPQAFQESIKFDVNKYFSVLDHLSVEEGYYFSHMYYYSQMFSGGPILYAEEVGKGPYFRNVDYEEYYTELMGGEINWREMNQSFDYHPHIVLVSTSQI